MTPREPSAPLTYKVKDLPANMQPRELFDRLGGEKVPDAVLLAILLKSGTPGFNVIRLAEEVLVAHGGSLRNLSRTTVKVLAEDKRFKGLGPAKARELLAALELGRRLSRELQGEAPVVSTPAQAAALLADQARSLETEKFWILQLDTRNRLKGEPVEITSGILNASLVHPREVFRSAVTASAAAVVLAHNHPSGDPSPSPEDLKITRELVNAGKIMDIRVLDHIIMGRKSNSSDEGFISLRESGLVSFEE